MDSEANKKLDKVYSADEYCDYLNKHIANVKKGYKWLLENIPEVIDNDIIKEEEYHYGKLENIINIHDESKYSPGGGESSYYYLSQEFEPYAEYFYGTKTEEVEKAFDLAWLHHQHVNPHHWQYWILREDEDGKKVLDMPNIFIIEMICDHWSFSWSKDNLYEIFKWYDDNKKKIIFSDKTKQTYESILNKIKEKLDDRK